MLANIAECCIALLEIKHRFSNYDHHCDGKGEIHSLYRYFNRLLVGNASIDKWCV